MSVNAIAGIVIIVVVLSLITFLIFWSNKSINRIATDKNKNLRTIIMERRRARQ